MRFASASSTVDLKQPDTQPVGRFAPSPSGPLHFGSLLTALASFLDIRSKQGRWLLRIDDIDTPRTVAGSEAAILATLSAHGLHWDGPISRQSQHGADYRQALYRLASEGLLFFCNCSRRDLKDNALYPGTCRAHLCSRRSLDSFFELSGPLSHAIRLRAPEPAGEKQAEVHDELQSSATINNHTARGDYVVFRRDGLVSYQLAVVVDDARAGVPRVVRGADLLPTTLRQQQLHGLLGSTPPAWLHLPVLLNRARKKLSKQTFALAVDGSSASANINIALQLLGQHPPPQAERMPVPSLLDWAIGNWNPEGLPGTESFSTFFGW